MVIHYQAVIYLVDVDEMFKRRFDRGEKQFAREEKQKLGMCSGYRL